MVMMDLIVTLKMITLGILMATRKARMIWGKNRVETLDKMKKWIRGMMKIGMTMELTLEEMMKMMIFSMVMGRNEMNQMIITGDSALKMEIFQFIQMHPSPSHSLLLIVSYVLRHGLSDSSLDDLLSLMNIHCPNSVPTSKCLLYKSVEDSMYEVHCYCMECTAYLGPEKLSRNCTNCGNEFSADISHAEGSFFSQDARRNIAAKNDESTRSGSCP
ncbi:uncharacterized protein LOC117502485 [Thalassophryne amazonica]|uniref:uncharacterized protein LOC117502485 n=1 Tax=Thalassophryne amazonica TaxID=390379 RepID=UPI001471EABE|nr:uncharacterized protein LOC117502485 [Thalassophryne amazonica]